MWVYFNFYIPHSAPVQRSTLFCCCSWSNFFGSRAGERGTHTRPLRTIKWNAAACPGGAGLCECKFVVYFILHPSVPSRSPWGQTVGPGAVIRPFRNQTGGKIINGSWCVRIWYVCKHTEPYMKVRCHKMVNSSVLDDKYQPPRLPLVITPLLGPPP